MLNGSAGRRGRRRMGGRDLVEVTPARAWAVYRRRRQLGLSREQVAEMASRRLLEQGARQGVVADYIRRVEWGEVAWTSEAKLRAVAEVLGLEWEKLGEGEEGQRFPGPAWRHPQDAFARRVRLLRAVEEWLRRCGDRELAVLQEVWPVAASLSSRLAGLLQEGTGGAGPLTPEHVFEQNMGSLWRTPRDVYEWLERLLELLEEVMPWQERVRRARRALLSALEWPPEEGGGEGKGKTGEGG
ncbi:hypothetical protein HRbin24_00016 [bacterium HR24]|nr:hypothetical protein HRbin24_00016 [bacterium HR24]